MDNSIFLRLLIFTFLFLNLCVLGNTETVEEDVDLDDAVVTTDEDPSESEHDDIPYSSPTPSGNTYFAEHFDDLSQFKKKWILSEAKKDDTDENIAKYDGKWEVEAPQKDVLKGDLGLVLKSKAKHAAISARLDRPFVFSTKPLIVQYEVTLQEGQECGGAYIKLLSQGKQTNDLRLFYNKTPYTIMFGPDKCGNDHKMHFIFRHKNPINGTFSEKHCKKPKDRIEEPFKDKLPHLYTLIVRPDNTFIINLDHKVIKQGSLLEDFTPPVNPPAEIDDPDDKKPKDWDEREKIPDPDATKPEDWDEDAPATIPDPDAKKPDDWLEDEPEMIPDPNAEKPEDWDNDMDGDWEAPLITNPVCEKLSGCGKWTPPMITNPKYKGKWRPPLIDNPNYKGKWKPRRIANPDYFEDKHPFQMTEIAAVGIELWSMSDNILFDNIVITDDPSVALNWAAATFDLKRRKFDKEGKKAWGKMMKSMNYKPGWWTIYFIYCFIPVGLYMWYLRRRVAEESLFRRLLNYTNDYPWLWAVYIVAVGLPVVLLLVFCCSSSQDKDSQDDIGLAKKMDTVSPDDEIEEEREGDEGIEEGDEDDTDSAAAPVTSKPSKSQLEVQPEEVTELPQNDNTEEVGAGDEATEGRRSPRKRNVRKEE